MLAYVFWHWPSPEHAAADYDALQRAFHAALAQTAPHGFQRSFAFRLDGRAPWLGGTPAYADWYLVDDSAALDPLNVAAVSGICEAPHNAVARAMAAGAGSLFGAFTDLTSVGPARTITFVTKPRTTPYETFRIEIGNLPCESLWRRQLVLGPTPEFALLSQSPLQIPATFNPLTVSMTPIWPSQP